MRREYLSTVSKIIQLRNVPDALHRRLKARAARAGMSLSEYLLSEFRDIAEKPTLAEFRERLHQREAVSARIETARLVREQRDGKLNWPSIPGTQQKPSSSESDRANLTLADSSSSVRLLCSRRSAGCRRRIPSQRKKFLRVWGISRQPPRAASLQRSLPKHSRLRSRHR